MVRFRTVKFRPLCSTAVRWPVPLLRARGIFLTPLQRLSLIRHSWISLIVSLVVFVTLTTVRLLVGNIPLTLCRVTRPFTAV